MLGSHDYRSQQGSQGLIISGSREATLRPNSRVSVSDWTMGLMTVICLRMIDHDD